MNHEIYALHFGDKRSTRGEFLFRERSQEELIISFYLWVVLGGGEPLVYDVGFDEAQGAARGLHMYRDRTKMLAQIDVDPARVNTVVMSHVHWDHWAGYPLFPNAQFLVQDAEIRFWRGPAARHQLVASSANLQALDAIDTLERSGRIRRLFGRRETLLVQTAGGPRMLASDALHFFENYRDRKPVQVTMDIPGALDAFDVIAELVGDDVIGGHDPHDYERFETVAPGILRIA
jgi:glyoxylase-like metal-dependent hydrolase (beta-lactamase superfamily II)